MRAHITLRSENAKTGPIPVTTTEKRSCPSSCIFRDNGCYAQGGPINLHWSAVSDGRRGGDWDALCSTVSAFPRGQLWRYGQAGDLPGEDNVIDAVLLRQLIVANGRGGRKRPIAYTHKPVLGDDPISLRNRALIKEAGRRGFPVNLSANNLAHADWLAELKIAPVVAVVAREYGRLAKHHRAARGGPKRKGPAVKDDWSETIAEYRDRIADLPLHTPDGRRIAVCPATYTDTSCAQCGACAERDRDAVIVFPAHGAWRKVEATIAKIPLGIPELAA